MFTARSNPKRSLLAFAVLAMIAVSAGSRVAVAILAFFIIIFLAGPHPGLLPFWLEPVVLSLGWLAVLALPAMLARRFGVASATQFTTGKHQRNELDFGEVFGLGAAS